MGYSFRLTARVLLYALSHRQDSTYYGLCYTSRGALAGTRNSSMGPPWRIDPTSIAPWANALTTELHLAPVNFERKTKYHVQLSIRNVECLFRHSTYKKTKNKNTYKTFKNPINKKKAHKKTTHPKTPQKTPHQQQQKQTTKTTKDMFSYKNRVWLTSQANDYLVNGKKR